ncbi:hypothetical protein APA386B_2195 [Acetobacter pasteurianus 386B]|nr:hypothetical protein APA386B_2195 [Acetobacter pasteurianus 386B]
MGVSVVVMLTTPLVSDSRCHVLLTGTFPHSVFYAGSTQARAA